MLSGPADAAQQEPRNEGGATGRCNGAVQRGPRNSGNPTEAPHENDTTDRTVCTVRFFCAVLRYGPKISHRACREFGRIF